MHKPRLVTWEDYEDLYLATVRLTDRIEVLEKLWKLWRIEERSAEKEKAEHV